MTEFLNSIDDELTAEYFAGMEKHLEGERLPLDLDTFVKLESSYYADWRTNRENNSPGSPGSGTDEFPISA